MAFMPFIFFPTFPERSLFDSSLIYLYITANRDATSHTVYATQTNQGMSLITALLSKIYSKSEIWT